MPEHAIIGAPLRICIYTRILFAALKGAEEHSEYAGGVLRCHLRSKRIDLQSKMFHKEAPSHLHPHAVTLAAGAARYDVQIRIHLMCRLHSKLWLHEGCGRSPWRAAQTRTDLPEGQAALTWSLHHAR